MSSATIRTGTDAWVVSTKPASCYQTNYEHMSVGAATRYSYLRFNSPIPRGATPTLVRLHLFGNGDWGAAAVAVAVQRIASSWSDSKVTYNNRPGVTGPIVTVAQVNRASGTEWIFDLTAMWAPIAAGSSANYGLRLSTTATVDKTFYGLGAGSYKPYMEFSWSDAPQAPTEMSPAGGASVTLASPTLLFNFHDVSGDTTMASCQVQINPTNSFIAPAFDSGEVVTSDPELDLTTTAYTGLAVGATAWWRVRVKDGAGLWSAWSDPVYWTRGTRGVLTLNSPTGASIEDPTQDVIWTVTGAVQTGWQVVIEDDNNPGKPLYDTGRRAGATNSWTIPKNVITTINGRYRITVRTWDDLSRVATPGDKIMTEVVNAFTFVPNGTADVISNVVLSTRPSRQPGMWITWDRANAPDGYEIRRGYASDGSDMVVVDTDLNPADLLLAGITYQYLDAEATAYYTHYWRVIAKTSTGIKYGPIVGGKFDVDTTWLEDLETHKLVPILFRDSDGVTNWAAPQIGIVAQPNAAKTVVRVTQGQAGLQGSVSGVIVDGYGADANTWAANLAWMRDRPDNTLRLTTQGLNFTVVIGDVVIAPYRSREDGPGAKQVSFNFWQQ